jgi:hypothetical protein
MPACSVDRSPCSPTSSAQLELIRRGGGPPREEHAPAAFLASIRTTAAAPPFPLDTSIRAGSNFFAAEVRSPCPMHALLGGWIPRFVPPKSCIFLFFVESPHDSALKHARFLPFFRLSCLYMRDRMAGMSCSDR